MAECKYIPAPRRKVCAGDMDRVITLQNVRIQPPTDAVDYTRLFEDKVDAELLTDGQIFALIKTVNGEEVFDQHNVGTPITHHVYIPYIETVTAETWILLDNGQRLDIQDVQNLDERNEFLFMRCTKTGTQDTSNNAI